MVWYSHLSKSFPQFVMIHTVKGFGMVDERDKKAFSNEDCLITEENKKRGKTRDLFRKTGNTKGAFYPKMGTIKHKNGRPSRC